MPLYFLALVLFTTAAADTWNTFRGNPQLTGVASSNLAPPLTLLWAYSTQDAIESTAALGAGRVYVGALNGQLYAIDLHTGALVWQYQADGEIKSSPTVADSTVYFGDEAGTFHAVATQSGQRRWTFAADAGITSSANYADGRLYFGSYDQHLYCLDAAAGTLIWKVATEGYIHGTPALYEDRVAVAGCDGYLRLLGRADGTQHQQFALGGYVASSAAIHAGRAYLGTFGNEVLGVDLGAGKIGWRYAHAVRKFPFYSSPAVADQALVIGGRDKLLHALDPQTGQLLWTVAAGARVDSSPVIAGEYLYVGADALLALALASGAEVWRFETGEALAASPAVAAGRLVIGATDGVLYCFGRERTQLKFSK